MTTAANSSTAEATICGVLVHSRPESVDIVSERLTTFPGVEVHGNSEDGRLVVTVEGEDRSRTGDTVMQIQNVEGVVSASLVYHFSGEVEDTEEEVSQ